MDNDTDVSQSRDNGVESGDGPAKGNGTTREKPSFMERYLPDATAHDRVNLVLTFVIAASTFLYMIFAGWTLWEIHSGSSDTHALALAAKAQATKITDIAATAGNFAQSASNIELQIKSSEAHFKEMANSAATSASTAQDSLRLTVLASRPYIDLGDIRLQSGEAVGLEKEMAIVAFNDGNTAAIDIRMNFRPILSAFGKRITDFYIFKEWWATEVPDIPAHSAKTWQIPVNPDWVDSSNRIPPSSHTLYLVGRFIYKDLMGDTHRGEVCGYFPFSRPGVLVKCDGPYRITEISESEANEPRK